MVMIPPVAIGGTGGAAAGSVGMAGSAGGASHFPAQEAMEAGKTMIFIL